MELAHPMAQPIGRAHPTAGTSNGLTCGRAASRSPDAADSPPTLVVSSKCGMEKEGGKSDAIISSCFISHFVSQSNIPDRQDKTSSVS